MKLNIPGLVKMISYYDINLSPLGVVFLMGNFVNYLSSVYCCHLMFICCTMCVLLFLLQMPDCSLEVSTRKVLRPATSTQVFLGFPVSTSEC